MPGVGENAICVEDSVILLWLWYEQWPLGEKCLPGKDKLE